MLNMSDEELLRLEDGLPDLNECGPALLVPFPVQRLARPSIAWLNHRWFSARGFDLESCAARAKVEDWILREFAFAVRDPRDPADAYHAESKIAFADRYGTTGSGGHGGSARVATIGKFQVKGIGRTPLTGVNVKWDHCQGWSGLEEAAAEATFGELLDEEFPFGANPVVAVLDTGLFQHPAEEPEARYRRSLMVRPSVLRPAHMLRSPLFTESINGPQSHLIDVRRTYDFLYWFEALTDDQRRRLSLPRNLTELASRLSQQAAFSEAHRIFSGGMFGSNVSLSGAVIDYGAVRAVRSWGNATYSAQSRGFGRDLKVLAITFRELCFYRRKAVGNPTSVDDCDEVLTALRRGFQVNFERYLLDLCGRLDDSDRPAIHLKVAKALAEVFAKQQSTTWKIGGERDDWLRGPDWPLQAESIDHWLSEALTACGQCAELVENPEFEPASETRQLGQLGVELRRNLRSRRLLDRNEFSARLHEQGVIDATGARAPRIDAMTAFIDDALHQSRRHWPRLPAGLAVCGHAYERGSSALRCKRWRDGQRMMWVEGTLSGANASLFGYHLPFRSLDGAQLDEPKRRWSMCLRVDNSGALTNADIANAIVNGAPSWAFVDMWDVPATSSDIEARSLDPVHQ